MRTDDEFDVAGDVGTQPGAGLASRQPRWNGALTWVLVGVAAIMVGVGFTPGSSTRELSAVPAPDPDVVTVMDVATGALAEIDVTADAPFGDGSHQHDDDSWLCGATSDGRRRCTHVPDGTVVVLDEEGNVIEMTIQVQR